MQELTIRPAQRQDVPIMMAFIRRLAEYEQLLDTVTATEEMLEEWMFVRNRAEALIAEAGGQAVGFALYFHNFSTFVGRAGLYIEDLFVLPEYRGKGYGKALLKALARVAVERECGRMEWACLDWNAPSIKFYLSVGAKPMDEWTVYRLVGDELNNLAELR
jgi:GNAT superfamily N-acetyltransferase